MTTEWNRDMEAAPRGGYPIPHVRALLADGAVIEDAHWACDLSGEEQPPFRGWFHPIKDQYSGKTMMYAEIEPVAWAPASATPTA